MAARSVNSDCSVRRRFASPVPRKHLSQSGPVFLHANKQAVAAGPLRFDSRRPGADGRAEVVFLMKASIKSASRVALE